MRSNILIAILATMAEASCRPRASTEAPRAGTVAAQVAPVAASSPSANNICGVIAHLDLRALAAISPAGAVDDLWNVMLPRELATAGQQAIARSTRAASLCGAIGDEHRQERAFILEGDYPRDLLERFVDRRRDFVRHRMVARSSAPG